jgi:hypothetical protein
MQRATWFGSEATANRISRTATPLALNQGCYRVTIYDSGDDGQSFWANSDGSGYTRLKKVSGGNFINFEPDFGKFISQAFFFQTNVVSVDENPMADVQSVVAFPTHRKRRGQVEVERICEWPAPQAGPVTISWGKK